MRRLVAETRLGVDDLVAPLFVREGTDGPVPVPSLPGVVQHTRESLRKEARHLAGLLNKTYRSDGSLGADQGRARGRGRRIRRKPADAYLANRRLGGHRSLTYGYSRARNVSDGYT